MGSLRSLDLNLASRPFRNNTLPWVALVAGMAAVGAFSWWNVSSWLGVSERLETRRAMLADVKTRLDRCDLRWQRAEKEQKRSDVAHLRLQAERANAVIARKALSWTRLFNILEQVQPYEVRMTQIRPRFADARATGVPEGAVPVSVSGWAQEIRAFLELERSLLFDPHFDRVEPEQSSLDESGEIEFELSFLYYPEGAGDRPKPDVPSFFDDGSDLGAEPAQDRAALRAAGAKEEKP